MKGMGRLRLPHLFSNRRTMEKEDNKQPEEMPSVKKIVDCPRCKARIEVEFEIGLDTILPMLGGASLPITFPPKETDK